MSRTLIDLTGKRFGKLVVRGRWGFVQKNTKQPTWLCKCDCGILTIALGGVLRNGTKQSCGCLVGKTQPGHRMTNTPTYNSWRGMIERCSNPRNSHFKNYGLRGITVDPSWKNFENFYADMGDRPQGHSIDRIDNDKGYFKANCRWADTTLQSKNTTRSVKISYNGETKCLVDWATQLNITPYALKVRLKRWDFDRAMSTVKTIKLEYVNDD